MFQFTELKNLELFIFLIIFLILKKSIVLSRNLYKSGFHHYSALHVHIKLERY